jgi:hypothetical protein
VVLEVVLAVPLVAAEANGVEGEVRPELVLGLVDPVVTEGPEEGGGDALEDGTVDGLRGRMGKMNE